MTKSYYPFDSGAGANVIEAQWAKMARLFCPSGVVYGQLNQLEAFADNTGMNVKVKSGQAFVEGFFFESDAQETLNLSAADPTNPRIDRVIVRLDRTANTIDLAILTGTPAGSPSAPALTQTATTWEISLARIAVAASDTSIAAGDVTDERGFTVNWEAPNIPVTIRKTADESVSLSTTLQDDNLLLFTATASGRYLVEFYLLIYTEDATPDFKFALSIPAGASEKRFDGASPVALSAYVEKVFYIRSEIILSTTGGAVKLQWAQDTSHATPVTVRAESCLRYTKIG